MTLIIPPPLESEMPKSNAIVRFPFAERSETFTLGKVDEYQEAIKKVRCMITMAIGCLKELSSQAVEKYNAPGMRFLIGEILSCLGQAKVATGIRPDQLKFNVLK